MDLTATLASARVTVAQALATCGTTVDVVRRPDPRAGEVDPVTFVPVADAEVVVHAAEHAFVIVGPSQGQRAWGAGRVDQLPVNPVPSDGALVVLRPELDVRARDEVVVRTSLNPQLVGQRFAVYAVAQDFADVATRVQGTVIRQS